MHNRTNLKVTVLDSDNQSINFCKKEGIDAIYGDALKPDITGDEKIVCFNLILHHLVGATDQETYKLQSHALSAWHSTAHAIFINEYIWAPRNTAKFGKIRQSNSLIAKKSA